MRKFYLFPVLLAALALTACEDDSSSDSPTTPTISFKDLCEATGGIFNDEVCECSGKSCKPGQLCDGASGVCAAAETVTPEITFADMCKKTGGEMDNGLCKCKGTLCGDGDICNASSGECPIPIDPDKFADACTKSGGTPNDSVCQCGGVDCLEWHLCVDGACPPPPAPDFSQLCSYSGGEPTGNICTCKGEPCDSGVLCNTETGSCSEPCEGENCGGQTQPTFEDACKASGGEAAGGICVCDGNPCTKGIVCKFRQNESDPITCADNYIPPECSEKVKGANCSSDNPACTPVCKKGTLLTCDGSKYVESPCSGGASCKNDTECGTCKNYDQVCENKVDGAEGKEIGSVMECQEGEPGKAIALCNNVSCRTDVPACGECVNGELKCTEDNNSNAIMYRCTDGKWERLRNRFDPLDPSYSCKKECRIDASLSDRNVNCFNELDAHPEYCDGCDPCAGVGGYEFRAYDWEFNPCYDEAKCKALKAKEADKNDPDYLDPDYPPFRMTVNPKTFEVTDECKAKGGDCPAKKITGFNYLRGNKDSPSETFNFDLTNHTFHVSCNADMTRFGQCHNSLQTCINQSYHQNGYIIQCVKGALSDYDGNSDGIACNCVDEKNKSAVCYTRRNCFKNSTAVTGEALCKKPSGNDNEMDEL